MSENNVRLFAFFSSHGLNELESERFQEAIVPATFGNISGWNVIPGHEGTVAQIRQYYEDEEIITSNDGKHPFRYTHVICLSGPSTTREAMKLCLEKNYFELQHEGFISVFEVSDEWISH